MFAIPPFITDITNDSRQVKPGCLFLALPGEQIDGRHFIAQAIAKGAAAVWYEATDSHAGWLPDCTSVPLVPVTNLAEQQSAIAAQFFANPSASLRVIGVTGTNGKTSITHFIAQALTALRARCGVIGTLGNGLPSHLQAATHTTPDAIQLQRELNRQQGMGIDSVAMEVSSHSLQQGRVNAVAFDVAVFTNLTRDHLDYHGSMEAYGRAKQRLFEMPNLSAAVINGDDVFGQALIRCDAVKRLPHCLTYSLSDANATVSALDIQAQATGYRVIVQVAAQRVSVECALLGRFNISNVLAVFTTLLALGYQPRAIADALSELKAVLGRMQIIKKPGRPAVVVDYAHTPDALRQALLAVREHCAGKLWCVFGCGGDRDRGKRADMGQVAAQYSDHVILTNDNPRTEDATQIIDDIQRGMRGAVPCRVELDRAQAIALAISLAKPDDSILVAGKGHEDYQIIGTKRLSFSDSIVVHEKLQSLSKTVS